MCRLQASLHQNDTQFTDVGTDLEVGLHFCQIVILQEVLTRRILSSQRLIARSKMTIVHS